MDMLDERIIRLIKDRFKSEIIYPQQCEALSMDIEASTGKSLGTTTLKRMLGFVQGVTSPRDSSLDIVAQYLGYTSYSVLFENIENSASVSEFASVESILSESLSVGDRIRMTYEPKRSLELEYLGNRLYEVKRSECCKLKAGDKLRASAFYVGLELVAESVEREGVNIGSYRAAKQGGLTALERL